MMISEVYNIGKSWTLTKVEKGRSRANVCNCILYYHPTHAMVTLPPSATLKSKQDSGVSWINTPRANWILKQGIIPD